MRAIGVHEDVIVFVSQVWRTACTAVRSGEEGFVIDSPVYPDELEALPGVLEQAGFPCSALLATHGDWDHLLGRLAFPELSLGCAETTAARLAAEPGAAQRSLRSFDEQHYVARERPLALGGVQSLPVPGKLSIGEQAELELHPADGHTQDGMAIWMPWAKLLVCGDYVSPLEIPMVSQGGSLDAYSATLERLRPLVEQATMVVAGHGGPIPAADARVLLEEDLAYLAALGSDGDGAELPPSRRSARQKKIHAENARLTRR